MAAGGDEVEPEALDHRERRVRFLLHLGRHLYERFWSDHVSLTAAALTYRTIFSLVPLTVLALVLFRAFGGLDATANQAEQQVYQWLGLSSLAIEQTIETSSAAGSLENQEPPTALTRRQGPAGVEKEIAPPGADPLPDADLPPGAPPGEDEVAPGAPAAVRRGPGAD